VHIKFNNQPLKQFLIARNSWGRRDAGWDQHSHRSASGKATSHFFLFKNLFSFFVLEEAEDCETN
jgi:hypothetical protein